MRVNLLGRNLGNLGNLGRYFLRLAYDLLQATRDTATSESAHARARRSKSKGMPNQSASRAT
jgi:hypothetical protein